MKSLVLASYNGSQQGVTVRDMDLNQLNFIQTGTDINDIAAGTDEDFFIASKNTISHYKIDGTLIHQMVFPDTGINYTSITARGDRVYAAYDGSQQGFTVRDLNLNQLSFTQLGIPINGIAAGMNDDLFLTSKNTIKHYKTDGTLITDMVFPIASINYPSVTTFCDKVYAAYNGSQLGFTVRDLNLTQLSFAQLGIDINSIAAGPNNDVFLTSKNTIRHYKADGTLINNMTFPIASINYTGVSLAFVSQT